MIRQPLILFSLFVSILVTGQDIESDNWEYFSNESVQTFEISKNQTFRIGELSFELIWEDNLVPNKKFDSLGGIKEMKVYKEEKLINTFKNIVDEVGLGEIYFRFYDYNMDGQLDFTLPINDRWERYFLFNIEKNKFQHKKSWDYLKIQKINKGKKLILTQPTGMDGKDSQKLYSIQDGELKNIKH